MTGTVLPGQEVIEELCARFILNLPADELQSFERLLFSVEEAHWYYEDFTRVLDPTLRSLSLKHFTALIFKLCPGLQPYAYMLDEIYARFLTYKQTVPVMGAIMLDPKMEKCLLVRGFKQGSAWTFPRGKINKEEEDAHCAIREVLEETGFDISEKLVEEDFVEVHVKQQRSKLYIVTGVEDTTNFFPLARKEIGGFAWYNISELPSSKEQGDMKYHTWEGKRHTFWMVWPYIHQLKSWIKRKRKEQQKQLGKSGRKKSASLKDAQQLPDIIRAADSAQTKSAAGKRNGIAKASSGGQAPRNGTKHAANDKTSRLGPGNGFATADASKAPAAYSSGSGPGPHSAKLPPAASLPNGFLTNSGTHLLALLQRQDPEATTTGSSSSGGSDDGSVAARASSLPIVSSELGSRQGSHLLSLLQQPPQSNGSKDLDDSSLPASNGVVGQSKRRADGARNGFAAHMPGKAGGEARGVASGARVGKAWVGFQLDHDAIAQALVFS